MRKEALTFTRFIAAFMVVLYHFGGNIFPFNHPEFVKFFLSKADAAVSYFFVLSGYVMILAYKKLNHISVLSYYWNRIARIAPNYFLALGIFIIFADQIGLREFFLNIFAIQSWVPSHALSMNFPDWTISVEMFFYLSFPFLFNFFFHQKKLKIIIAAIVLWFLSQITFIIADYFVLFSAPSSISHDFWFRTPLVHFNEFLIGSAAALFFINNLKEKIKFSDLIIIGSTILMILFLTFPIPLINYHNGLLALFFVPILWGLSQNKGLIFNIFRQKPFIILGEISYAFYIFQYPVHLALRKIFKPLFEQNPDQFFILFLSTLLLFSIIIFYFFENPLRKLLRKWKPSFL